MSPLLIVWTSEVIINRGNVQLHKTKSWACLCVISAQSTSCISFREMWALATQVNIAWEITLQELSSPSYKQNKQKIYCHCWSAGPKPQLGREDPSASIPARDSGASSGLLSSAAFFSTAGKGIVASGTVSWNTWRRPAAGDFPDP